MAGQGRLCPLCNEPLGSDFCPTHGVPTLVVADLEGPPAPIEIGTIIGGRYRIESLLSQGGMGAVLLAEQLGIGRTVVIKVVKTDSQALLSHLKRFYREAMAMSRLNHPNIVRVHEFGVDVPTRAPFLIMEHVEGRTLRDVVDDDGPMGERRAAHLLSQVARALLEAHNHGVLHRDLKPRNIMVRPLADGDELVKVLDFGLARIKEGDDPIPPLTQPGKTIGTPAYMSPEQVTSGEQDGRTDLYGLGCVLHMVLTGAAPYLGNDLIDTMRMHLNREIPTLPVPLADGAAPTEGLIVLHKRLLAKRKSDRPGDASEVARDLQVLAEGNLQLPKMLPLPPVPDGGPPTEELDNDEEEDGVITTTPSLQGIEDGSSDGLLTVPATSNDLAMTELGSLQDQPHLAMALGSGAAVPPGTNESLPAIPVRAQTEPPQDVDAWTTVLPSSLEPGDSGASGFTPSEDDVPNLGPSRFVSTPPLAADTPDPLHLVVPEPPRRSPLLVLGSAFVLVLGAGIAALAIRGDKLPAPDPPTSVLSQKPPTAVPAIRNARATLKSQPSGADVFFADVRLGKTPLEVDLPSEGAERNVSVELDGFEQARVSLHADSPKVILVPLAKRKIPAPSKVSKRTKAKRKKRVRRLRRSKKAKQVDGDADVPVW